MGDHSPTFDLKATNNAIGAKPHHRQELRDQLAADTEAFLSKGGVIDAIDHRALIADPWLGSGVGGKRTLISATQLGRESDTDPKALAIRARQPGAPKAYMFMGELHFVRRNAIAWARGERGGR